MRRRSVLIDRGAEILHMSDETRPISAVCRGEPSHYLLTLSELRTLRLELRTGAFSGAANRHKSVDAERVLSSVGRRIPM